MHTWKHTFEATDFAKTDNGKRRIQRYMQTYIPFMHDSLYTIPLVSKDDYVQFPGGGPRMRWTTLCRRTSLYFFSNSFEHHSLHLGWIHKLFWIVMSIRQQIQTPSKRVRTNPIYSALTPLPFYSGYPRTDLDSFACVILLRKSTSFSQQVAKVLFKHTPMAGQNLSLMWNFLLLVAEQAPRCADVPPVTAGWT